MVDQTADKIVQLSLYSTVDPTTLLDGRPLPALTVLLYRVCHSDPEKFEEATRIVELFIREAVANV